MLLDGRSAIVTGGGMGIGRAICIRLAQEGARVAIFDTILDAARETAAMVEGEGGTALALEVDVSDMSEVESGVKQVLSALGTLDMLVNNAGISHVSSVARMTEDVWDRVNAVNLKGVFLCCHAVIPAMKQRRYGKIVNIASILALNGTAGYAHYSATKAGVVGFTRSLAVELGPHNICVNAIGPGIIQTPMAEQDVPPEVAERLRQRIPLRRHGTPADVADAVLFLVSDASSYVTGQCIYVCGGLSADAGLA